MAIRAKGVYIYHKHLAGQRISGIDQKVKDQIEAFNSNGFECRVCASSTIQPPLLRAAMNRLPFCDGTIWPIKDALSTNLDFVYIRKPLYISRRFISFLKSIKKRNPKTLMLMEIPTWPLDYRDKYNPLIKIKDRVNTAHLDEYIDMIFYMGDECDGTIYNCKTTHIFNGVSLQRTKVKECLEQSGEIHLVCAARFCEWHGMDRVIEGLGCYYQGVFNKPVYLHLVGDGEELTRYRELTDAFGLQRYVVFHGFCNQDEMSRITSMCSIGLSSLGRHRSGSNTSSAIKEREYLAQGLPFVFSCDIDLFSDGVPDYCMKVPADDTPISIDRIVEFHDRLFANEAPEGLANRIRSEMSERISVDTTMMPVFTYIESHR